MIHGYILIEDQVGYGERARIEQVSTGHVRHGLTTSVRTRPGR